MTENLGDKDLRARFAELRREVTASTPPFSVRFTPRARAPVTRWITATVGLAATLAVVLVIAMNLREARPEFDVGLDWVVWHAPTDFLLETPGSGLLSTVPTIGVDLSAVTPISSVRSTEDTL